MNNPPNMSVLLIDDDDVAREVATRSFKKNNIPFDVVLAVDGLDALEILQGKHASKTIEKPFVILLDLNMPRMNGFEFLDALRASPALSSSIVFVLTTSNDDHDRLNAYERHIAGYMDKSVVGPQFQKLSSLLQQYNEIVTLPELENIHEHS